MNFENQGLQLAYEGMYHDYNRVENDPASYPIDDNIHEFSIGDKSIVKRGDSVYFITSDHSNFVGLHSGPVTIIGQLKAYPDYLKVRGHRGDKFTKLDATTEINLPKVVLTKTNPAEKKVWTSRK